MPTESYRKPVGRQGFPTSLRSLLCTCTPLGRHPAIAKAYSAKKKPSAFAAAGFFRKHSGRMDTNRTLPRRRSRFGTPHRGINPRCLIWRHTYGRPLDSLSLGLSVFLLNHPELAKVVSAWPRLSEPARGRILSLVWGTSNAKQSRAPTASFRCCLARSLCR